MRGLVPAAAWTLAGRLGALTLALLTNALLARVLSPGELGDYFLLLAYTAIGTMLGGLGMKRVAVRFLAERTEAGDEVGARTVFSRVSRLASAGACGAALIYLAVAAIDPGLPASSPAMQKIPLAVAAWLAARLMLGVMGESFRGLRDYRSASLLGEILGPLLFISALLALWSLRAASLASVVWTGALTIGACGLLSWGLLRVRFTASGAGPGTAPGHWEMLRTGLPIMLFNLVGVVGAQSAVLILAALRGSEEVAYYGAALRLVKLAGMPLLMVNALLAPQIAVWQISSSKEEMAGRLRAAAALSAMPSLLLLALLFLAGEEVLTLVFGPQFGQDAPTIRLLCLGYLPSTLVGSSVLLLMMTGHQNPLLRVQVLAYCGTIAAAIPAAYYHGASGAALAVALGKAIQSLGTWRVCLTDLDMRTDIFISPRSARAALRNLPDLTPRDKHPSGEDDQT